MFRNLNPQALGVSGRQSELIELALTYGFRGMDLDMVEQTRLVENRGAESAGKFLASAQIKIGGFELPIRWQGDDAVYREDLGKLAKIAETAALYETTGCFTTVMPACDERPYHENFEFHRQRFSEIADILAPYGLRLGLGFLATPAPREGKQFQFISSPDALLTLMKTLGVPNVGIVLDLWHWHIGGGTLEQIRELTPEQIVAVRIADVAPDADLSQITEQQRLIPGVGGAVDVLSALQVVRDLGYEGPVSPFANGSQFTGMTRDGIVHDAGLAMEKFWLSLELVLPETTNQIFAAAITRERLAKARAEVESEGEGEGEGEASGDSE